MLPFVWAVPDRTKALRLCALAWGAAIVVPAYGLAYLLSADLLLAVLAGLNWVTSAFFVTSINFFGIDQSGVMAVFCCVAAAFFLAATLTESSASAWLWSCFWMGLSIGFAPQAAALVVGWGVSSFCFRRRLCKLWSGRPWAFWCSFPLAGIGIAPMLLANLMGSGFTFDYIRQNLGTTSGNVHNAEYLRNLAVRLQHLVELSTSQAFYGSSPPAAVAFKMGFLVATVALAIYGLACVLRRGSAKEGTLLVPVVCLVVFFLLSPFTLNGLNPKHFLAMLPLWLAVVAGLPALFSHLPKAAKALRAGVILGLVVSLALNAGSLMQYWTFVESNAGRRLLPRLEPIANWLVANDVRRLMVFNSISLNSYQLSYLIDSEIEIADYYSYGIAIPKEPGKLDEWVRKGAGAHFMLFDSDSPGRQPGEPLRALELACMKRAAVPRLIKEFPVGISLPTIRIFSVESSGAPADSPDR
ncbi:MAG: hypothetical protein NTY77_17160 [Elusimicrobia bacterium]|nr:hypothetical protein [Elusimicrobiota bacterium]